MWLIAKSHGGRELSYFSTHFTINKNGVVAQIHSFDSNGKVFFNGQTTVIAPEELFLFGSDRFFRCVFHHVFFDKVHNTFFLSL